MASAGETWTANSQVIVFDGQFNVCVFCIVLGFSVLLHSAYLNGRKLHLVRICSDVVAATLVLQAGLLLSCITATATSSLESACTVGDFAIRYDFGANAVCGLVIQLTDNYLTFTRYSICTGGTSTLHKVAAGAYVLLLNTMVRTVYLVCTLRTLLSAFPSLSLFFSLHLQYCMLLNIFLYLLSSPPPSLHRSRGGSSTPSFPFGST